MMIPRLDELAQKIGSSAKIMKMNVDESPLTPQRFKIMSIPTIIIFKNGAPFKQYVGTQTVEELE